MGKYRPSDQHIKIAKRNGMWAIYAPQGSGLGYYGSIDKGYWYAMGSDAPGDLGDPPRGAGGFVRACSKARCWIRDKNTDWSDPSWDE